MGIPEPLIVFPLEVLHEWVGYGGAFHAGVVVYNKEWAFGEGARLGLIQGIGETDGAPAGEGLVLNTMALHAGGTAEGTGVFCTPPGKVLG